MNLKGLHIFDDRPALLVGEAGAIFVSSIAVAVGVPRIGSEAASLERRLVGGIADIFRIEDTAANHETRLTVLSELHQFPQVRYGTVVKIGSDRPDTVQHARFVSSSGDGGRRIEHVAQPCIDEPLELNQGVILAFENSLG